MNYEFDCGCSFPIQDETIKKSDGLPSMHIPYEEIQIALNYGKACPETWKLVSTGNTKGIFQLESNLGQAWAKRLKPESLEEMAALVSLIRPGTLRAMVDCGEGKEKSMTQLYVDRKHHVEEIDYFHTALEPILSSTYGVMTFQEQAMRIAVDLAGFNEQEADVLRKAIGKKKADIMAQVKTGFIEGCKKVGLVSDEEAESIFGWIQESQRYSFNKSHGVGYGVLGYLTALVKHHFPIHFYCSWIKAARSGNDTQNEVRQLISDAKLFDIGVGTPNIETVFANHSDVCIHDSHIYFGIRCVKKIGQAATEKFLNRVHEIEGQLGKRVRDFTWIEFLVHVATHVTTTTVNNLISVGLFNHFGVSRNQLIFEYEMFKKLTAKERKNVLSIASQHGSLIDILSHFVVLARAEGGPSTDPRRDKIRDIVDSLKNPPHGLDDKSSWILTQERNLLGTPLSISKIDTVNTHIQPDTTCKEFRDGKNGDCIFTVEVVDCREWEIQKGSNKGSKMGFLTIEDSTGQIDCVAFSDVWDEFQDDLYIGNTIAIVGSRSKQESLQISKVFPI